MTTCYVVLSLSVRHLPVLCIDDPQKPTPLHHSHAHVGDKNAYPTHQPHRSLPPSSKTHPKHFPMRPWSPEQVGNLVIVGLAICISIWPLYFFSTVVSMGPGNKINSVFLAVEAISMACLLLSAGATIIEVRSVAIAGVTISFLCSTAVLSYLTYVMIEEGKGSVVVDWLTSFAATSIVTTPCRPALACWRAAIHELCLHAPLRLHSHRPRCFVPTFLGI